MLTELYIFIEIHLFLCCKSDSEHVVVGGLGVFDWSIKCKRTAFLLLIPMVVPPQTTPVLADSLHSEFHPPT